MRKRHCVHHDDSYNSEMKLGGAIYLHDISLTRMLSATRKSLEAFQKLCDDDAFQSVILGTTKWGDVFEEDGEIRTQLLREYYWRDMIDHGSKVFKFEDSSKSAWTMVDSIVELNRSRPEVLQIQREPVDAHKFIPDIEVAGQKLPNDLDQVLKNPKEDREAGDAHFTDVKEGDIIVPYVSFLSNINQSR